MGGDERREAQAALGKVATSARMPFHAICTPMASRMNAERRVSTAAPLAPSRQRIASA